MFSKSFHDRDISGANRNERSREVVTEQWLGICPGCAGPQELDAFSMESNLRIHGMNEVPLSFPIQMMPRMCRVRQPLDERQVKDVASTVIKKLRAAGIANAVKPGARIAITAGSRGIGGFSELLQGIIAAV